MQGQSRKGAKSEQPSRIPELPQFWFEARRLFASATGVESRRSLDRSLSLQDFSFLVFIEVQA